MPIYYSVHNISALASDRVESSSTEPSPKRQSMPKHHRDTTQNRVNTDSEKSPLNSSPLPLSLHVRQKMPQQKCKADPDSLTLVESLDWTSSHSIVISDSMFQWFIVRTSSSTELRTLTYFGSRHIIQISPCKGFFGQSLPWLKLSLALCLRVFNCP